MEEKKNVGNINQGATTGLPSAKANARVEKEIDQSLLIIFARQP
jgi:hypothetical protein